MIHTAIFSGSFNPIHIGHLLLANYVAEYLPVDECWFVLSPSNPFKNEADLLNDKQRLEMLNLALEGYPKFRVCDIELSMPKPSYTIRTLEALQERYPERKFSLIIGADNWQRFEEWYEYRRILEEFAVWIYPRLPYTILYDKVSGNTRVIDAPRFEISSTELRRTIAEGKDMRAFLPEKVYEYIRKNKLYGTK